MLTDAGVDSLFVRTGTKWDRVGEFERIVSASTVRHGKGLLTREMTLSGCTAAISKVSP